MTPTNFRKIRAEAYARYRVPQEEQRPPTRQLCGCTRGRFVDSSQLQKDIQPANATNSNGTHLNVDNGTNDLGDLAGTVGSSSAAEGTASACCLLVDEKKREQNRWVSGDEKSTKRKTSKRDVLLSPRAPSKYTYIPTGRGTVSSSQPNTERLRGPNQPTTTVGGSPHRPLVVYERKSRSFAAAAKIRYRRSANRSGRPDTAPPSRRRTDLGNLACRQHDSLRLLLTSKREWKKLWGTPGGG